VKILVVKLGHLGDTLVLTPTLRFLKTWQPQAQVDVMIRAGGEELLRGNPHIARVLTVAAPEKSQRTWLGGLRQFAHAFRHVAGRRYDYAFDLADADRAKFWIALSAAKNRGINDTARRLGWKGRMFNRFSYFDWTWEHQAMRDFRTVTEVIGVAAQPGPLEFFPQTSEAELRTRFPFLAELKNFAVIHPVSRWPHKQWLPERWAEVADDLKIRRQLPVVFSCGPAQREIHYIEEIQKLARAPHFSTQGQTTLHQLGLLLRNARLFLGVDTVAMHLAAAMQTPSVVLFGPSSEWSWRPWQCRHELVLGECPCKAARQFVCDKSKPYPCMLKITVANVCAAMDKLKATP
jgi:heptosyltransferase-3